MILRARRRYQSFTIIDNGVIRDRRLSFRARGVLAYILSLPDWGTTNSERIANAGLEGRDAIRSALAELETAGYLVRERRQDPDTGRWATVSTVYDTPVDNPVGNDGDNTAPTPENPAPENQALKKYSSTNTVNSSNGLHKGTPVVCGECAGTGWTVDQEQNVIRCDCPGGVWLNA